MMDILTGPQFHPAIILAAYFLDMSIGDPEGIPHPVRLIGRLIAALERALRLAAATPLLERLAGAALALLTVGSVFSVSFFLLGLAARYSTPLFYLLCAYMIWTSLAVTSLKGEARAVVHALRTGGLAQARKALSRIVGRDTSGLSEEGVFRAAVETVSENASDGVVAPLFYLAIGGPALMMAYKAVNTLDSMVGYKNERYMRFGWFSARLDDAANYIPARLTALLMVCASFILRYNWRGALKVLLRDGRAHPSPNAGMPEAAVAGALGIRLGGGASYGGVWSEKPFIGEAVNPADAGSVDSCIRMMQIAAFIMAALTVTARAGLPYLP